MSLNQVVLVVQVDDALSHAVVNERFADDFASAFVKCIAVRNIRADPRSTECWTVATTLAT
jgi:hypothetical protein